MRERGFVKLSELVTPSGIRPALHLNIAPRPNNDGNLFRGIPNHARVFADIIFSLKNDALEASYAGSLPSLVLSGPN